LRRTLDLERDPRPREKPPLGRKEEKNFAFFARASTLPSPFPAVFDTFFLEDFLIMVFFFFASAALLPPFFAILPSSSLSRAGFQL